MTFLVVLFTWLLQAGSFQDTAPAVDTQGTFLEVQYNCTMREKAREQRLSMYLQFISLAEAQEHLKVIADEQIHSLFIDVAGGWAVFEEIYVDKKGDTLSQDLFYQENSITDIYAVKASDVKKQKVPYIQVHSSQLQRVEWEVVEDEYKEILGFTCQKALLKLGDITYAAWFTPEIPLSYGPKSYMGADGLILELEDNTYHFEAVAIREVDQIPFFRPGKDALQRR